ncbi:MAG: glycosyltransferase [Verrucomicrobia bacterium]|nr:glycosyltransferase [Verrucomicrobiota bacterium]
MSIPTLPCPLISVVVLNYNGARWTPRCLDSLKAQTIFPQLEIIVADNASSALFSLTLPLSRWERGQQWLRGKIRTRVRTSPPVRRILPLPAGEGRGEGERSQRILQDWIHQSGFGTILSPSFP